MKLVVMTQSTFFVEEDKILSTLFEEGLENLHLCKPGNTPIYFERLLSLISEDYNKKYKKKINKLNFDKNNSNNRKKNLIIF